MNFAYDLSGQTFTYLFVVSRIGTRHGKPLWSCVCKCGKEVEVASTNLLKGISKSCGCYAKRNQVVRSCKICGNEFNLKLSHSKKRGVFCSYKCMGVDQTVTQSGDSNPNYKHGKCYTAEYRKPYHDAFKKAYPEKIREYNRNCKAKRRLATGSHTAKDIYDKLYDQWYCCYWCLENLNHSYEIDHIIPLSKGGSNDKENVVPTCSLCNRQKRDKLVSEWILEENCRNKRNDYNPGTYSEWL